MQSTSPKRIEQIDALRGFALFGIISTHMFQAYISGVFPSDKENFNILSSFDKVTDFIVQTFFMGKFYTIFSLLFGLSFYLILDQRVGASTKKFAWRLFLLFCIGMLHQTVYGGDILSVYALYGLLLLLFRKSTNKKILIWGLLLTFNAPTALISTAAAVMQPVQIEQNDNNNSNYKDNQDKDNSFFSNDTEYYDMVVTGDFAKLAVYHHTSAQVFKLFFLGFSGRIWGIPGLFLLGLWIGRNKYHEKIHEIKLEKILLLALLFAFLTKITDYLLTEYTSFGMFYEMVLNNAFSVFVSFAYIAIVLVLYQKNGSQFLVQPFVSIGKMGLSVYLMQSLFGTFLFYGYGFGMLHQLSATQAVGVAMLFFVVQIVFSKWWFTQFKFGPVEWLWRCATNRKMQSIRL